MKGSGEEGGEVEAREGEGRGKESMSEWSQLVEVSEKVSTERGIK